MAAGLGTRMRSTVPKHLHPVLGRRLVDWVIAAAREVGADPIVVVTSPGAKDAFADIGVEVAIQDAPRGTGAAVRSAHPVLGTWSGDVLVLSGDTPCLTGKVLGELVDTHRSEQAVATVLTFVPPDPRAYGRVIRDEDGRVRAIVEARDASPDELAVDEVNSSIYVFRAAKLWPALELLDARNAQGELYLTDAVSHLVEEGESVAAHVASDPRDAEGVNTRVELAEAAAVLQTRINERHMLAGVTILDPASAWIEPGVELEPDVTIHPWVYLRGTTRVRSQAEVMSHTVAVDAEIRGDAIVGPFCYLRPGTTLEASSKAGTFVEIKNSRIGERTKVPHLSYIGDAVIGDDTNVGAGAITANLPHATGQPKAETRIGRNVRTGIQNGFVAPVEVGDGAWTAAGSVITKDVPSDALAVARARQENKEGYAARHRDD
jgi:bifunctional UDP-N-acetylglucosamine pyrophosphorylase/glucosamine-1-phosphate N-acetyltransferase